MAEEAHSQVIDQVQHSCPVINITPLEHFLYRSAHISIVVPLYKFYLLSLVAMHCHCKIFYRVIQSLFKVYMTFRIFI